MMHRFERSAAVGYILYFTIVAILFSQMKGLRTAAMATPETKCKNAIRDKHTPHKISLNRKYATTTISSRREFNAIAIASIITSQVFLPVLAMENEGSEKKTSTEAQTVQIDSTKKYTFLAALVMHWLLWSKSSMSVALAWDFICIADVLYSSTIRNHQL
jgi:hypothetical protein